MILTFSTEDIEKTNNYMDKYVNQTHLTSYLYFKSKLFRQKIDQSCCNVCKRHHVYIENAELDIIEKSSTFLASKDDFVLVISDQIGFI